MTTAADKIRAKVFALNEEGAMAVYTALRLMIMKERKQGNRAPVSAEIAMEVSGNALEERIGFDRFDALMGEIDDFVYG